MVESSANQRNEAAECVNTPPPLTDNTQEWSLNVMAKSFFTFVFLSTPALFGFAYAERIWDYAEKRLPKHIVHVPVDRPEPSLKELITKIPPKYGIPSPLMAAVVHQESGAQRDAIRFESTHMDRARRFTNNADAQRLYASSIGYAQVMGWWAPQFKLVPADLFDPETNIEVSSAILAKCLERHREKNKYEKFHGALSCYNGSTVYADKVMSRLGRKMIEEYL